MTPPIKNALRHSEEQSKVKAQIFTRLFYRHWNAFTENKRSHLFVVSAHAESLARRRLLKSTPLRPDSRATTTCRRFPSVGKTCMPSRRMGRNSPIRATSTRWKPPAQTTKSFLVPIAWAATPKKISTSPGSDYDAAVFAGRQMDRVALAGAGRLRERQVQSLLIYDRQLGQTPRRHGGLRPLEWTASSWSKQIRRRCFLRQRILVARHRFTHCHWLSFVEHGKPTRDHAKAQAGRSCPIRDER